MKKNLLIGRIKSQRVTVDVTLENGRLSISGQIWSGAPGGEYEGGQCQDSIREYAQRGAIEYAAGWDRARLDRLLEVWDRWHLNDMKPECEHQRAAGWPEIAAEVIRTYQWRLKPDVSSEKKCLEDEALERARSVEECRSLGFKAPEWRIMALEQFIKTPEPELSGELARWYEATKDTHGYFAHVEEKTRGWINYDEDARGLLGKPCETCGYKYGTAWRSVEVPPEIIAFIESLPETTKTPHWV